MSTSSDSKAPNPVGWFEIPVVDIDRAAKFYGAALGYEVARQDMFGGEFGFMAQFEDSEGNRIGLHEPPAAAPPK